MTLSEYTQLKQQIVFNLGKSNDHHHLFIKLKEFYRDDIDSERKFEQITTVGQLLNILEVRDVLSEDNVGPLKEIARRLNNNDLMQKISDYEVNHVPREYINYYALENKLPISKEINKNDVNNDFIVSTVKTQRIRETIEIEIGRYWRDLARNLKIREVNIEDIDSKYEKSDQKAKAMLEVYFERCDKQRWFYDLCNALEKSRRKDLSKSVQEIMVMNV